jgi:hypothetical protein
MLRRQPVTVKLWEGGVVVTLHGKPARGCTGGLTEPVFTLAGLIGG